MVIGTLEDSGTRDAKQPEVQMIRGEPDNEILACECSVSNRGCQSPDMLILSPMSLPDERDRTSSQTDKTTRSLRSQLLRGSLLGLVSAVALLIWFSCLFGYSPLVSHCKSMEPALRDGDALWVRHVDVADVKVGDIVTLSLADQQSVTHRVVMIEPLSHSGYLLVTKGDANWFTEEWKIGADEKVAVLLVRVPYAGYVVEFLISTLGKALLICFAVGTLIAIVVRRARRGPGSSTRPDGSSRSGA